MGSISIPAIGAALASYGSAAGSFIAANAGTIAAVGTAASAGVAAYSSHEQGVATANSDKQKARQASLDASQKQIDMRQNMLRALASQNAGTEGAIGTGTGTSFGANTDRQISQAQNDLAANTADASAQISLLDQAGANAESAGNLGAIGDLAGGASKIANMYAPKGN